jgi:hypothetical protein
MIDISTISKGAALAALYNRSEPQGLGILQFDPRPMTEDEANAILAEQQNFDYLKGRVMKVDLTGDPFDPWRYDRDNGEGSAARAIAGILCAPRITNAP